MAKNERAGGLTTPVQKKAQIPGYVLGSHTICVLLEPEEEDMGAGAILQSCGSRTQGSTGMSTKTPSEIPELM